MPFLDFENRHFTEAEQTAIQNALQTLEAAFRPKLASLNAQERQQYGSVNEQNKLIINKVKDYHDSQPNLCSPEVNWEEFNRDFESRTFLENSIGRLTELNRGLENAKILHDWDNYQATLVEYSYVQYKEASGAIGYATKLSELRQFFLRAGRSEATTAAPDEA